MPRNNGSKQRQQRGRKPMTLPQHKPPVNAEFAAWQRFRAVADGVSDQDAGDHDDGHRSDSDREP